jgi:hypothetical protein
MIRHCILILLAISFSGSALLAQVSVLTGSDPDYAGTDLVFYQYSDLITYTEVQVARCAVQPNGHFECRLDIDETSYVFIELGIYKGYLFIEPGSKYRILLPPREDKTEVQRLNPYFQMQDIHIGIEGVESDDLNFMIGTFNLAFNEHFDDIILNAYYGREMLCLDSLESSIEARYEQFSHPFFHTYRNYRYGLLRQLALIQRSRSISDSYFLNKPIEYNNPAYMELFNLVYDKYLLHVARTARGNEVFENISTQRSYSNLKNTLSQDEVLSNDTLQEMVILKGLYDGFFDDKFSRSALLAILDSIYRTTSIAEHLLIAQNIRTKITRLLPGFVPVPFSLYNVSGEMVSLNDFKGKYVYLNFCTTSSYSCLQEFVLLQRLFERHGSLLEIVTVCVDQYVDEMRQFLEHTKYPWTFLHYGNNPEIVKDFDIRAYPTYFLIGPDQRLILSPAQSPRENFELQLFRVLRSRGEI